MASNILSRFLPPAAGEPSIYETLRQQDDESDQSSLEGQPNLAMDDDGEGNARYQDHDLNTRGRSSHNASQLDLAGEQPFPHHARGHELPKKSSKKRDEADVDNEVPQSLLIEEDQDVIPASRDQEPSVLPPPVPGPSNRSTRARWQAAQREQQLHHDPSPHQYSTRQASSASRPFGLIDPKERATWIWANVDNLDGFLNEVYHYYTGHGIWSILLSRAVRLLYAVFSKKVELSD